MAVTKVRKGCFGLPNWNTKLVNQFQTEHKDIEKKIILTNLDVFFLPSGNHFFALSGIPGKPLRGSGAVPIVEKVGKGVRYFAK